MNYRIMGFVTAFFCVAIGPASQAGEQPGKAIGAFVLKTDPGNAYLPSSLRLKAMPDVELLHPKLGLNFGFTDYAFRNKFYREENKYVWERQKDPRFVTDVNGEVTVAAEADGDFTGQSVSYSSSIAAVRRRLLFHRENTTMRIVYDFTATRDIMIHMPHMFYVGIRFSELLNRSEVLDARNPAGPTLAFAGSSARRTLCNTGPVAVSNTDGTLTVLVSHTVTGDVPTRLPYRMIELAKGKRLVFTITAEFFEGDRDAMLKKMREIDSALDPSTRAARLYATGYHVLHREKKEAEGEALLQQAAELAKEWYLPQMMIADYRLQNKVQGVVRGTTMAQNFHEGAFRMPWNYGCILRGGGYMNDPRLTEEQQRLLLFNLMCALENTLFYPNYYAQLARPFEQRNMYGQACAIYRQALWACDHYPVTEKKREKYRNGFRKKIAELEKKLLSEMTTVAPMPIEVRPEGSRK